MCEILRFPGNESSTGATRSYSFDVIPTNTEGLVMIDGCLPLPTALAVLGVIGDGSRSLEMTQMKRGGPLPIEACVSKAVAMASCEMVEVLPPAA